MANLKDLFISKVREDFHFNVTIPDDWCHYSDVDLSVRLKALRGKIDQGGGLVWRYKDPDNYYVARINPIDKVPNFTLYKVVKGVRKDLQMARFEPQEGHWYTIRCENIGNKIKCFLDGKKYLELEDYTYKSGKIGLWTKCDAVTAFDNLIVKGEEEKMKFRVENSITLMLIK